MADYMAITNFGTLLWGDVRLSWEEPYFPIYIRGGQVSHLSLNSSNGYIIIFGRFPEIMNTSLESSFSRQYGSRRWNALIANQKLISPRLSSHMAAVLPAWQFSGFVDMGKSVMPPTVMCFFVRSAGLKETQLQTWKCLDSWNHSHGQHIGRNHKELVSKIAAMFFMFCLIRSWF